MSDEQQVLLVHTPESPLSSASEQLHHRLNALPQLTARYVEVLQHLVLTDKCQVSGPKHVEYNGPGEKGGAYEAACELDE